MKKDLLESVRSLNGIKKDYECIKNGDLIPIIPDEAEIPDVMRGLGAFMKTMGMDMGMFTIPKESMLGEKEAEKVEAKVLSWDYKDIEAKQWGLDVGKDDVEWYQALERSNNIANSVKSSYLDAVTKRKEEEWLNGFRRDYKPTGNYDIDNSYFAKQLNSQPDCPSDPYLHDNIPDHKELTPNEIVLINRRLDRQASPNNPGKVYVHGVTVSRHPRGENKHAIVEVTREVGFRYIAYLYTSGSILLEGKENPHSPRFTIRPTGSGIVSFSIPHNVDLESPSEESKTDMIKEDAYGSSDDYSKLDYRRRLKNGYIEEVNEWSDVVGRYTYKNGVKHGYFELFNEFSEDVYMKGYQRKGRYYGLLTKYFTDGAVYGTYNYSKKGKLNGLTTTYYRTGEKLWEVKYVNGSLDGMTYKYDKNGDVIESIKYAGGREIYSHIK